MRKAIQASILGSASKVLEQDLKINTMLGDVGSTLQAGTAGLQLLNDLGSGGVNVS